MSKARAIWNAQCDAVLVENLLRKRAEGLQTSNGNWHSSAWTSVETSLAGTELFSGGSAKTAQSCQNHWAMLKKEYKEVKAIREMSGFGWDNEKNLVTAEDSVWAALIEAP